MINKKIRVVWFTNVSLLNELSDGSGSWLFAMRDIICDDVELFNVIPSKKSKRTSRIVGYNIIEYQVPLENLTENVNQCLISIKPNLIHIWGTESIWASFFSTYNTKIPILLEIQGVLTSCFNVFWGGLSQSSLMKFRSIFSIFLPTLSMDNEFKRYKESSEKECKLINKYNLISTQSNWTRGQIHIINQNNIRIFRSLRPIRRSFIESRRWGKGGGNNKVLFSSLSYCLPFKGLHVLFKILSIVKQRYPDIVLKIAGIDLNKGGKFRDDYTNFLKKLILDLGIDNNLLFLGRLNEKELVEHLLSSDVFINPSFVESFSASSVEALALGVPSLLAYAGAMPEFSNKEKIAEYYCPLDFYDGAAKVLSLLEGDEKNEALSITSYTCIRESFKSEAVRKCQIDIYSKVLSS